MIWKYMKERGGGIRGGEEEDVRPWMRGRNDYK